MAHNRADGGSDLTRGRALAALIVLGPVLLALAVTAVAHRQALLEVAWPDEVIYLVGARNVLERGTLDTNFYLTYSLLRRGYPHRDVHMPGYLLALTPAVAALGPTLRAAAAVNGILFAASTALVYAIGRALLPHRVQAVCAAALFAVLPPFPGYLFVAYPEIVVSFVFLAGLAVLVHARGWAGAAAAGALFGAGALFRETLLLALPLYLVRVPPRTRWRAFAPAAAVTFVLVVVPCARDRAPVLRARAGPHREHGHQPARHRAHGSGHERGGRGAGPRRAAGADGRAGGAPPWPRIAAPGRGDPGFARAPHRRRVDPLRRTRAWRGMGRRPRLHGLDAAPRHLRDSAPLRAAPARRHPRPRPRGRGRRAGPRPLAGAVLQPLQGLRPGGPGAQRDVPVALSRCLPSPPHRRAVVPLRLPALPGGGHLVPPARRPRAGRAEPGDLLRVPRHPREEPSPRRPPGQSALPARQPGGSRRGAADLAPLVLRAHRATLCPPCPSSSSPRTTSASSSRSWPPAWRPRCGTAPPTSPRTARSSAASSSARRNGRRSPCTSRARTGSFRSR